MAGFSQRTPRLLLAALALGVLAMAPGCGWEPVYGGSKGGAAGPAQAGLAETSVALIPERSGQLLRQALQAHFDRGGAGTGERYLLAVSSYGISADTIGIQPDNTTSRVRLVGRASWSLVELGSQRRTLTSGYAQQMDGYNVIDQQYFASDQENDSVQRRMADAIAEQITLEVAAYFHRHAPGG
jgi:LPS-assembly lipoprotein